MKLCIGYTVFGTELLNKSIANIIDHVDMVLVCYQEISNTGTYKPFGWSHHYHSKIKLLKYDTDLNANPKENERRKHQAMIDQAYRLGCSHFILSATDHFYKPEEFESAKKKAVDYDVTFTSMFTYFKFPNWQLTPIEDYYMPFIFRLPAIIQTGTKYPVKVDPSVRVRCKKWYLFKESEIMLHHFSMVRKNIAEKFKNAASAIGRKNSEYLEEFNNYDINANPGVKYFKGRKIKVVENAFEL